MEIDQKCLPSEKLQKEFEDNPIKLLDIIRKEKEEQKSQIEESKNNENMSKSLQIENGFFINKDKSNLDNMGNDA